MKKRSFGRAGWTALTALGFASTATASAVSLKETAVFDAGFSFARLDSKTASSLSFTQPILLRNRTLIFTCAALSKRSRCYALRSDGTTEWTYPAEDGKFVESWFRDPVLLADGTIVLLSSFGQLVELQSETGLPTTQAELQDPNGKLDVNQQGPFQQPSAALDGRTVLMPSNTGAVFFVAHGKVERKVQIGCRSGSSAKDKACYFRTPVLTRNDGLMAILEGNWLLTLGPTGEVWGETHLAGSPTLSLSEDGSAFLVVHDDLEPDPKNPRWAITKSRISVLAPGDGAREIRVGIEKIRASHASMARDGTLVFTGEDFTEYSTKRLIGIVGPGETKARLVYLKDSRDTFYSFPIFDKGHIYAANLGGAVFMLDARGDLAAVAPSSSLGEIRETPVRLADGTVAVAFRGLRGESSVIRFLEPSAAESGGPDELLAGYEASAGTPAIGMCDGMRSSLLRYASPTFGEMHTLIPAADAGMRFTVVRTKDTAEYFVSRGAGRSRSVRKLSGPEWTAELMPLSKNFFNFVFFKDKPSDCALAGK